MLTLRFLPFLFLMFMPKHAQSTVKAQSVEPFSLFSVRLDASTPIKVQPDFSHIGRDLGYGFGDIFSFGARSFADTMHSSEYQGDLSRGMRGLATNLGDSFGQFNEQAEATFFPELTRTFRGAFSSAINPRNVFQFGGLVALSFVITTTGYYLTKLVWEVITQKVLAPKPVIVLPGTTYGWWDRIKHWWAGYKTPLMICDESVKTRLIDIEEKTKKIRSHNRLRKNRRKQLAYDNLLLCGQPGTGKTLFAQVLADRANMDIVITTAASLLQSGVQGVKYFNDIMRMAQKSRYGLILFIDEADALFVDRDMLLPDSDHYKIVSHILAVTGQGNSKLMLIAATNHAQIIDSAMGRRFQERVDMPLPGYTTRVELINAYIKHDLDKETQLLFFHDTINTIADKVEGLSHAEIADMIRLIGKQAYVRAITAKDVDRIVDDAVKKQRKTEEDKQMRIQARASSRKLAFND